jgi:hypothetical protein
VGEGALRIAGGGVGAGAGGRTGGGGGAMAGTVAVGGGGGDWGRDSGASAGATGRGAAGCGNGGGVVGAWSTGGASGGGRGSGACAFDGADIATGGCTPVCGCSWGTGVWSNVAVGATGAVARTPGAFIPGAGGFIGGGGLEGGGGFRAGGLVGGGPVLPARVSCAPAAAVPTNGLADANSASSALTLVLVAPDVEATAAERGAAEGDGGKSAGVEAQDVAVVAMVTSTAAMGTHTINGRERGCAHIDGER